jgi:hypothetical protein
MATPRVSPQALQAVQEAFTTAVRGLLERNPIWVGWTTFPHLLNRDQKLFDELFHKFRCRSDFKQVASDGLRSRLKNALLDAFAVDADLNAIAAQLARQLEEPMRCEIIFPLQGIDLQHVSLMLAPDVRAMFLANDAYTEHVIEPYERAAVRRDQPPDLGRRIAEAVRPRIANQSVLRIVANGDENVALWAAEKRADLAVDALQFVADISEGEHWRYQIDWRGRPAAMAWQSSAVIPLEGHVFAHSPAVRTGPMALWQPRPDALAHIQEHLAWSLAMLPLKITPTVHEKRLGKAIRAIATASRAATADEKKMAYVSVFDIFFATPGGDVTRNVREGVAFTMWGTDQEHDEERLEQAQFVNRVYESRSLTTHEFQIGVFEPQDLSRLRLLSMHFISYISDRPFADENKRDIEAWLQSCRETLGRDRYEPYNAMSRERIEL